MENSGWKNAYKYAKSWAGNHGLDSEKKVERADQGLPLGARIGGLLTMQKSSFIRANVSGSLIDTPEDNAQIKAVSRVNLSQPGNLFRFYLETGDDDNSDEQYLQVFQNENNEISELLFCTRLTRIIPDTEAEQDAYMGQNGTGLGEKTYTLWREQLANLGFDDSELICIFGESDRIDYRRDAGDPESDFYAPFKGTEVRVDDENGEHGLKQQIFFMPYVRDINGTNEYLLITTEIVESQDGDQDKRSIHVDFMIGLPIEKERVTIL
jgi:hypothetical protein